MSDTHTVANVAINLKDQSVENDSTVTTIVNEMLSLPDSTGKQYATQRTSTTQKTYRNKKNDIKSGSKTNIDKTNKSNLNKKSGSKSDTTTKVQQKEEIKTAMPLWIQKGIPFLVALIAIAGFIVLRRYGVFLWLRGIIRVKNKRGK
jgi:hypothetical protein